MLEGFKPSSGTFRNAQTSCDWIEHFCKVVLFNEKGNQVSSRAEINAEQLGRRALHLLDCSCTIFLKWKYLNTGNSTFPKQKVIKIALQVCLVEEYVMLYCFYLKQPLELNVVLPKK